MTHSFLSLQTLPISLRKWRKPALTVLTLPLLISPALPAYAQDYTSGLVGYWAFDETSGTTAIDNSSNSIDGTLYNIVLPTQSVAGIKDTAYNFIEGSGNRVELGDNYDLDGSPFTLSLWINVHTINSNYEGLIDKFGSAEGYRIFFDTNGRLNFDIRDSSGTVEGFPTPTGTITTGSWIHIAVSFDNATTGRIYINGTEVASKTNFSITRAVGTRTLLIGRSYNFGWFDGAMDEVRIYNRVLTPSDVTALYESAFPCKVPFGFTGEIIFNDDVDVMQYCNGNEWVGMGASPTPDAWGQIGNSRTIASSSSQSGIATLDTNLIAFVNRTSATLRTYSWDGTNWNQVGNGLGAGVHMVAKIDTNTVAAMNANTTGTHPLRTYSWDGTDWTMVGNQLDIYGSTAAITELGTNQIAYVDRLNNQLRTYAWDGTDWSQVGNSFPLAPDTPALATLDNNTIAYNSNGGSLTTFSWDGTNWSQVGNALATGGSGTSDMTAIDSSTIVMATNQDIRVYSFDGTDWSLSYQTEDITGSSDTTIDLIAPNTIAMKGWNGNSYLLRTFGVPSSCSIPTSGLVGHWAMDETTGTAVSDGSGNSNNGTWSGETAVVSTSGKVGTAFSLDGADDMITVPHSASLDISSGYTVSGWVYFDSTQAGTITPALISKNDGGGWGSGWVMGRASGGGNIVGGKVRMVTQHNRNISSPSSKASGWIYPVDTWNYVTVSWDGNTIKYYLDGTLIESGIISVPPDTSSGDLWIGHGRSNWYSVYHQGSIDEMRLYNYALSDTEVASLYGASGGTCNVETCSSPFGFKGGLIFNTTHNVMQYCNGKNWTAMGPAGNGGSGCSNPTGVQAELMYNSDLNVLQYCEGDEWVGITPKMDSLLSSGLIGHWKLDETSGATIADSSGNGNNAIWTDNSDNNVTGETTVGAVGNAIIFDGTETVASVGSVAEINNLFNGGGTIATWFKANGVGENNYGRILEKATGTGASNGWSLTLMNGPRVRFWREFSGGDGQWGNIGITYGKWHHIAVAYDDSDPNNDPIIYLDGSIIATSDSNSTGTAVDDSAANFTIGNSNAGDRTFDGAIDDTRLYNRALSASEISELYNAGTPPITYIGDIAGHWKLDETSGSTIADSSGNSLNGTWSDGVNADVAEETVAAPVTTGLHFDGSNDVINIPDPGAGSALDAEPGSALTLAAWVYADTLSGYNNIITKGGSNYMMQVQGNKLILSYYGGGAWHDYASTGSVITTGQWHHVAITEDNLGSAGGVKLYVDGSEVNGSYIVGTGAGAPNTSDANLYIGSEGGTHFWDGMIDDVRIYQRELSASDISDLYSSGSPINAGLIALWALDETSGTTAYDSIGSNDGTMTNMDGASNNVAGPVSSALSFSSSRITAAAASTDLDDIFNGGGTISYWIYPTNWGTFGRVVDKSDSGTFPPNQGWHSQGDTGIIKFSQAFSTTHGDWETGTNTVPMNTWSHIVITYDNSSDANAPIIYVNGVNSALTTVSPPSGTAVSDASQPITLGARQGGANNYTGYADDIRMYNRVLTASEVTSLYNLGTP